MRTVLPIVLIVIPLVEIALFVLVGDAIGLWPTLAATVLTAILGAALIRGRGLAALRHLQPGAAPEAIPLASLLDGAVVVVAGLLLIIPGFLTDLVGLVLLVRPVRHLFGARIYGRFGAATGRDGGSMGGGTVIEGEAVIVREPPPRPPGADTSILMPPPDTKPPKDPS